jgi:hypothetical protein
MNALPSRLARGLDAALSGREDPTALGLVRVLVVSVLLASAVGHVGAVGEYFSDEAWIAGRFAREAFPSRWSLFFSIGDPTAVRALFALGIAAHVAWLVGLHTRIAGIVSMLLWTSMYGRSPLLYAYPDQLGQCLGLLLVLMPAGNGLSLDAALRGKGGPVPVWCRRLLQLQLAIMYTATGLVKTGDAWRVDGTALYYTLVNPYNRHFDLGATWAHLQPWVLRPATYAVLVWEVGFGGFVALHWVRESLGARGRRIPDLRKIFLGFGVLMHGGIQVLLYVVFFSVLCVASYAAFLSPAEARHLVERVTRPFTRRAGAAPEAT